MKRKIASLIFLSALGAQAMEWDPLPAAQGSRPLPQEESRQQSMDQATQCPGMQEEASPQGDPALDLVEEITHPADQQPADLRHSQPEEEKRGMGQPTQEEEAKISAQPEAARSQVANLSTAEQQNLEALSALPLSALPLSALPLSAPPFAEAPVEVGARQQALRYLADSSVNARYKRYIGQAIEALWDSQAMQLICAGAFPTRTWRDKKTAFESAVIDEMDRVLVLSTASFYYLDRAAAQMPLAQIRPLEDGEQVLRTTIDHAWRCFNSFGHAWSESVLVYFWAKEFASILFALDQKNAHDNLDANSAATSIADAVPGLFIDELFMKNLCKVTIDLRQFVESNKLIPMHSDEVIILSREQSKNAQDMLNKIDWGVFLPNQEAFYDVRTPLMSIVELSFDLQEKRKRPVTRLLGAALEEIANQGLPADQHLAVPKPGPASERCTAQRYDFLCKLGSQISSDPSIFSQILSVMQRNADRDW